MSDNAQPRGPDALSTSQVAFLAVACTFAIATLYYSQPLLPLIGAEFGTGDTLTSQIVTASQIGYALGLFLFVPIGDRVDRRRLILTLLVINTAGMAACAAAPSLALFMVATLIAGAATVTPQIVIPTVAGMASPAQRGRAVGIVLSGMSAGLLLGRTLSGLLGEFAGWRAVFVLAIGLNLMLIAIVWRVLPSTRPTSDLPYPLLLRSLGRLFLDYPTLRAACFTGFLAFGAFGALWATLAPLLARPPYQLGADVAGLFGLIGLVSMVAAPIQGRLTDRLGARVMIAIGAVMLLIAFAMVSQTERGLWALAIGVALTDLGYRSVLLGNQTRIYPLQPSANSRLNTVFMTVVFIGGAFGSLCGAAAAAWSWTGVALVGAGFAVATLAVHLWTARKAPTG
jgi:predicted MFS family arabinose efflux permease